MISSESWNIIEKVIRRYPYNKLRYKELLDEAITKTPSGDRRDITGEIMMYQSPTESAAMKLSSEYCKRLTREILSVEEAFNSLRDEEKKVVGLRYWRDRKRNTPFLKITESAYSEAQMRRICRKMIVRTGRYLGEII